MLKGEKLAPTQENFMDYFFIRLSDYMSPYIRRTSESITPNHITTMCVISGVFALRSLYNGYHFQFLWWAILTYFLDCLDGHYARKYNMCTIFGDFYDHITDWIYYILVIYIAFIIRGIKYEYKKYQYFIMLLLIIFFVGMLIHLGCQEDIFSNERNEYSPCLALFRGFCKNPTISIQWTKWLGCGTFNLVLLFIIYFFVQ